MKRRVSVVCMALTVLMLSGLAVWASNNKCKFKPTKGVVPPHAKYDGKSYEEWAARWWQWAFSMVVSESPLYDTTG